MTKIDDKRLEAEIDALPARFQGPGGVVGVVSEGRVEARRAVNACGGSALTLPRRRGPT